MFPVIDFRNGRYQGQTRNQLPHGVGFFIDKNFLFCVGQWLAGEISGHAILLFPSGRVFAGSIAYRQQQGLCLYELAEDHVQLVVDAKREREKQGEKMAAVLPLLRIVLEIDNKLRQQAKVLKEYAYSSKEEENRATISKILGMEKTTIKELSSFSSFIQYFRDKFLYSYPEILEFIVNEQRGRKEYFMGLRGEGLGVKVEPAEQPSSTSKQSGRVYCMRAMGYFTKDNQLRDLGLKAVDNPMKGVIIQQGVFSNPSSLLRYQPGKRPHICSAHFHNYIKRSLYYRDKVLDTEYIYHLENFVLGFNKNLRVVETERLAQFIMQNPNNSGQNLAQIERKRREREREREKEKANESFLQKSNEPIQAVNPYNPTDVRVQPDQVFTLNRLKDEVYRSAQKKKALPAKVKIDYHNVEYNDPNLSKEDIRDLNPSFLNSYQPTMDYRINEEPLYSRPASRSPLNRPKSKSTYQYLHNEEDIQPSYQRPDNRPPPPYLPPSRRFEAPFQYKRAMETMEPRKPAVASNRYLSRREIPRALYHESALGEESRRSPVRKIPVERYPQTDQPAYKSYLEEESMAHYRAERQERGRPRYNYHFEEEGRPASPFRL